MLISGSRLMLVATEFQLLPTCDISGCLHYFWGLGLKCMSFINM